MTGAMGKAMPAIGRRFSPCNHCHSERSEESLFHATNIQSEKGGLLSTLVDKRGLNFPQRSKPLQKLSRRIHTVIFPQAIERLLCSA